MFGMFVSLSSACLFWLNIKIMNEIDTFPLNIPRPVLFKMVG
jgi:hypothetical protein